MTQQSSPANSTANRYTVIPRTLTFITNASHQILLLHGALPNKNWPGLYNGIGGHVELGETIEQAARREIAEETGITVLQDFTLRGTITIDTGTVPGILIFIFSAHTNTLTLTASAEGIPQWISTTDITSLPLVPDVPELITTLFSATTNTSHLFHRHYPAHS